MHDLEYNAPMSNPDITPAVFIPKPAPRPANAARSGTFPYGPNPAGHPVGHGDDKPTPAIKKDPRMAHDTVTLSASGEKMVNLNRGNELAGEIRNAPTDQSFAERLSTALEDIRRIGVLFGETLKAAFRSWR